jgi:hypothetical protein
MTQIALGAVLAPVKISVTVLATISDFRKDRVDVAFLTRHAIVHAAQWKRRPAVIEVG